MNKNFFIYISLLCCFSSTLIIPSTLEQALTKGLHEFLEQRVYQASSGRLLKPQLNDHSTNLVALGVLSSCVMLCYTPKNIIWISKKTLKEIALLICSIQLLKKGLLDSHLSPIQKIGYGFLSGYCMYVLDINKP